MYSTEFSKESLRKVAEQKVGYRITLKLHIFLFILGNTLLFLINWIYTPRFLWALIVLFSWLIGLVIHIIAYILYSRGVYPMSKRGLIFLTAAYIFGSLQLTIINFLTLGAINWALIPMIFGAAAVLTYLGIYLIFLKHDIKKVKTIKSRKERAVEKELKKMEKKLEQMR